MINNISVGDNVVYGKNDPLVSIIIPTYNRGNLISKAIDSILTQTYKNYEIIIVNDGSTDNTKEVIGKYDEDKIKYYQHAQNKGAAAAINTGIKNSNGDFISFQGSDDIWLPKKLEKEMNIFKKSNEKVGIVYSGYWYFRNHKKIYIPSPKIKIKEGDIHFELLKGNFVSGLSLIRKICFEQVGLFDENLPNMEDWEFYIRISKHFNFKFVDEPLAIAYCTLDSESINYIKNLKSSELILQKHFESFNKNKELLAINYANLGLYAFICGEEKKCRKYLKKSFQYDLINFKCLFVYVLSFLGKKNYDIFLDVFFILKDLKLNKS